MRLFDSPKKRTYINITSLIDILFLLIIFFTVSTQFTNQRSIGVELPSSKTGSTISTQKKLMIVVKEEDSLFINGKPVKWAEIEETVRDGSFDKSQKVILNIDKRISHGKVIRLLDVLKKQEFKKVVFGTYASQRK